MQFPSFIKFSLPANSDLFYKVDTRVLFHDGHDENSDSKKGIAFSKLDAWVRQTLQEGEPSLPLTFSYVDRDGDKIAIFSTPTLRAALQECDEDSLKVLVQAAPSSKPSVAMAAPIDDNDDDKKESATTQHNDAIDQIQQDLSNLSTNVNALRRQYEKWHPKDEIDNHNTQHQFLFRSVQRARIPLEAAFLLGDMCFLSCNSSRTALQFRIGGKNSRAIWNLTLPAGTYRAVLEIADCETVGGTFWVGLVASKFDADKFSFLKEMGLPYTVERPRYKRTEATSNKVVAGPFTVDAKDLHLVVTGSNSSYSLVAVTLESQL